MSLAQGQAHSDMNMLMSLAVVVINRHSRFNAGSTSAWFPVSSIAVKTVGKDSVAGSRICSR
jgi:hypothetical protein